MLFIVFLPPLDFSAGIASQLLFSPSRNSLIQFIFHPLQTAQCLSIANVLPRPRNKIFAGKDITLVAGLQLPVVHAALQDPAVG
jgi:hypothetical protein